MREHCRFSETKASNNLPDRSYLLIETHTHYKKCSQTLGNDRRLQKALLFSEKYRNSQKQNIKAILDSFERFPETHQEKNRAFQDHAEKSGSPAAQGLHPHGHLSPSAHAFSPKFSAWNVSGDGNVLGLGVWIWRCKINTTKTEFGRATGNR